MSKLTSYFSTLRLQTHAIAALLASAAASIAAPAYAADANHPVVVELFQSQGCNSCPPANANVNALSGRPDVLALSFAVTYWDRLGWKDTFAKQQFTDRQWAYARSLRRENVYTPQVVIDGRIDGVGTETGEIEALARKGERGPGPALAIDGGSVAIGDGAAPAQGADVWLVRYDPRTLDVAIHRGENAGKILPHKNIVREITLLGHWSGKAEKLALPPASDAALSSAVLVQTSGVGPILAAVRG